MPTGSSIDVRCVYGVESMAGHAAVSVTRRYPCLLERLHQEIHCPETPSTDSARESVSRET
jgi:hypothetical protein